MNKLVTSGDIERLFLEQDAGTIIRRPSLRRFAQENGVESYVFEKAWLITVRQFMEAVTPKGELPRVEMPIIRCKDSALAFFNERHDYAVDKHTIDRAFGSPKVSKYRYARKWFLNYLELERVIEERIKKGLEKKREKGGI